MTSISNTGIINVGSNCGCVAFAPSCSVVYTPSIPNIILKDLSTYDSGDSAKSTVCTITDTQGNVAYGKISNTGSGCTFGTVTFTASGPVLTVPVSAGGTGYCAGGNGTLNITFAGGAGSGAAAYAVVTAGVVTSVVVTAGGTGYTSAPTPTLVINTTVISLSGLSLAGGINIHATVVSTERCVGDLYLYNNPNTATLTTTIGDGTDEVDEEISQDTE